MPKYCTLLILSLFMNICFAQSNPKLVVGIVIDQMRYDFLYRYDSKYGKGGFKRLMNEGFHCKNNHYNYVPTYTGPGHTSIYTGTVPAIHGIISNNWYQRGKDKMIYCSEDNEVKSIGTDNDAGMMSPKNMLTTTICDQLRLHYSFRSKAIGIALKDRGAILPAGHTANAAYWFDSKSGNWITSSFYMNELPKWVDLFNQKKLVAQYLSNDWNTLLPIDKYTESSSDDNNWEEMLKGETKPVFPHKMNKENLGSIRSTPYGNNFTKDFAIATIEGEQLGADSITDFLAVSFSSPDYVGHAFGPQSIEIEDTYIRLDKDIEDMLNYLDKKIGKDKYLVFLTADHGVADVPGFSKAHKIPSDILDADLLEREIDSALFKAYGEGRWMLNHDNDQVFLNRELMTQKNIDLNKAIDLVRATILKHKGIQFVVDLTNLDRAALPLLIKERIVNGYHQKRSGEVQYITEPGWIIHGSKGTTHGSAWNYDTHIPLLFFGAGVKKGETTTKTSITDIAPTIANQLNILAPNGSIGQIIPIQK